METYTTIQRIFNIINRASEEFEMPVKLEDELQNILADAENTIMRFVDYDRIDECEISNSHKHIWWTDGMGFAYECDGDFFGAHADMLNWYRKDEQGKFNEIDYIDANWDTDYVEVDRVLDSKGDVVLLLAK